MKNLLSTVALAVLALAGSPSDAAIVVQLTPSTANIAAVGGTASVDIVVSGLTSAGEIVSGFDFDILFNTSLVDASASFNLTQLGGMLIGDVTAIAGGIELFFSSAALDDDSLVALQGDSFTLATLTFTGLADGATKVSFGPDPDFGRNLMGRRYSTLDAAYGTACVTVGADATCRTEVPEPATYALVGLGLLLGAVPGLRRARRTGSGTTSA